MKNKSENYLKVWGSRGGLPASGNDFSTYGHATCCAQIKTGDRHVILDAGSGIMNLGRFITESEDNRPIDILISHYHFDHIIGLPFFSPLLNSKINTRIFLPILEGNSGLSAIDKLISPPLFPVTRSSFMKNVEFIEFQPNDTVELSDKIKCKTKLLPHPGSNTGFQISNGNFNVVYASDLEAQNDQTIDEICDFSENSNFLLVDSSYTALELKERIGWGHLSLNQVQTIARKLPLSRILVFHHDYKRKDFQIEDFKDDVFKNSQNITICKEGDLYPLP